MALIPDSRPLWGEQEGKHRTCVGPAARNFRNGSRARVNQASEFRQWVVCRMSASANCVSKADRQISALSYPSATRLISAADFRRFLTWTSPATMLEVRRCANCGPPSTSYSRRPILATQLRGSGLWAEPASIIQAAWARCHHQQFLIALHNFETEAVQCAKAARRSSARA